MTRKEWNLPIIFILVVIAIVGLALSVPITNTVKDSFACNQERADLQQSRQLVINELNPLEIVPGTKPKNTQVATHGCSKGLNPLGIVIKKEYNNLSISGGEIIDSIRSELIKAGYSITKQRFSNEGCGVIYRANAEKNDIKLKIVASDTNPECTSLPSGTKVISEDEFRMQTIDSVLVYPEGTI